MQTSGFVFQLSGTYYISYLNNSVLQHCVLHTHTWTYTSSNGTHRQLCTVSATAIVQKSIIAFLYYLHIVLTASQINCAYIANYRGNKLIRSLTLLQGLSDVIHMHNISPTCKVGKIY